MNPASQILGDLKEEEECHSSESGWTKYIGSPATEYDDGSGHGGGSDNNVEYDHHTYEGSLSDDSMASDASSGPIRNDDRILSHEEVEEAAAKKTRKKKVCRDNDDHRNKARKEREVDQLKKQGTAGSSSSWVRPKQGSKVKSTEQL